MDAMRFREKLYYLRLHLHLHDGTQRRRAPVCVTRAVWRWRCAEARAQWHAIRLSGPAAHLSLSSSYLAA